MQDFPELRPLQALVVSLLAKHRRLLCVLPRQEGKTELGIRFANNLLLTEPICTTSFIAKDTKSARRATREKFLRIYDPKIFSINTDRVYPKAAPGNTLNIISCDKDPDRGRGGTNHFLHWSEVAFSKLEHGETIPNLWDKVFNPTLKNTNGMAYLETTANGKNGFYDLWEDHKTYGFHRFLITYDEMLHLGLVDQETYDRVKATTHPLVWRQEYQCEFISFRGIVYEEFQQHMHVQEVKPPEDWQRVLISIDWGWEPSATCVLFGYVRDDVIYVFDEIYAKKQLLEDTRIHIKARLERWSITGISGVADHEDDRIEELVRHGIPCAKADKANVLGNRIEVKEKLWRGQIVVDPRCQYLIRDLQSASWHSKREGDLDYDMCSYGHYDAEAALRYLVRAFAGVEEEEPDVNPHIGIDEASARAYEMRRELEKEPEYV